jgi:hypothetical protein
MAASFIDDVRAIRHAIDAYMKAQAEAAKKMPRRR